ncbi:MAG: hypothetical protein DRH10_08715 [Deltaproteobacteria bacterium]|nr:MAG: hypothetical protein DRH10_08715 [Deltaproteobacteria bacterium]
MCAPITVTTGGATGGCSGVCRLMPQIIASLSVIGVLILNFKGLLGKCLLYRFTSFKRKSA